MPKKEKELQDVLDKLLKDGGLYINNRISHNNCQYSEPMGNPFDS